MRSNADVDTQKYHPRRKKEKERKEKGEKEEERNSACALCIIVHYVAFTSRVVNHLDISISRSLDICDTCADASQTQAR